MSYLDDITRVGMKITKQSSVNHIEYCAELTTFDSRSSSSHSPPPTPPPPAGDSPTSESVSSTGVANGGCPTHPSQDAGSGRAFSAPLDEEWFWSDCCAHQLQVREM